MKIETKYDIDQMLYITDGSAITTGRVSKITIEHSVLFGKIGPLITYHIDGERLPRYESEVAANVAELIRIHSKLAHL